MKKSWGLTQKILEGDKTIETRWYKNKSKPWNLIRAGDTIYFKDTGSFVTVVAKVSKVEQYDNLNDSKIDALIQKYGKNILGSK